MNEYALAATLAAVGGMWLLRWVGIFFVRLESEERALRRRHVERMAALDRDENPWGDLPL